MVGGVRRFRERLKKDLKDREFRRAFEEEELYASVAIQIARIRQKKKLTQRELARRLKTTQQTVSRLEDRSYSLKTLERVARALDKRLKGEFV